MKIVRIIIFNFIILKKEYGPSVSSANYITKKRYNRYVAMGKKSKKLISLS